MQKRFLHANGLGGSKYIHEPFFFASFAKDCFRARFA